MEQRTTNPKDTSLSSYRNPLLMLAILFLGFTLRLDGLLWGLPNTLHPSFSYHPDEIYLLTWADMLREGNIIPKHFIYGGTFYYITLQFTNYLGTLLTDYFGGNLLFNAILVGRVAGILYALMTIAVVYATGRILFSPVVGLVAALVLTVMPAHVFWAQRIRPDELFALEFAVALLLAARIQQRKGNLFVNLIVGGLCLGIAIATRFPAGVLFLPFLAAIIFPHDFKKNPTKTVKVILKEFALLSLIACLGYLFASPHSIIYFDKLVSGLQTQWSYQSGVFEDAINRGPIWFQYGGRILIQALGLPFYLLMFPALGFTFWKRRSEHFLLLTMILSYFFLLAKTSWVVTRYTIPLLPAISILLANMLYYTASRSRTNKNLISCILLFTVSWTIFSDLAYSSNLRQQDPRDTTAIWINENIPPGATIGAFISYRGDKFTNPPANEKHHWIYYNMKEKNIDHFLTASFDYIVINMTQLADAKRLGDNTPNVSYSKLYQWSLEHPGYSLIETYSNEISFAGLSFGQYFSSVDYMLARPVVMFYKKNTP